MCVSCVPSPGVTAASGAVTAGDAIVSSLLATEVLSALGPLDRSAASAGLALPVTLAKTTEDAGRGVTRGLLDVLASWGVVARGCSVTDG